MRTRLTLVSGLLVLVGWGCGGDDGATRETPGEEGARAAVVEYSDAFVDKRYDDVCALLTARAQREIEKFAPCPKVLKQAAIRITDKERERLKDKSRSTKITVTGDRATLASVTDNPKETSNLVRQNGRWFIDADSPKD